MDTLYSYPKILHLGDRHISTIFDEPVEVTEKIDGSQFVFGVINGELQARSKGARLNLDAPEKMFQNAVNYIRTIEHLLVNGVIYFSEYLQKPKHNVLAYDKTPKNGIALFGVLLSDLGQVWVTSYAVMAEEAQRIGVDVVPLLDLGKFAGAEDVLKLLDRGSYLGGQKVEGVVVKNYKEYFIADRIIPVMAGKFVSEKFKEKHSKDWKVQHTGKGRWETFLQQFKSEARWQKAVQRLRETGRLDESPRDIGNLIKEVQRDIIEEEKELIQEMLWGEFGHGLLRNSVAGVAEWYKKQLAKGGEND